MTNRSTTTGTRHGFTLLEVMTALSISAVLMASSMVILRSSYAAWQAHEADLNAAASANAVLRQIVQTIRQADSIVDPDPPKNSGNLTIVRGDGTKVEWYLDGESVKQGDNTSTGILANGIIDLSFTGYLADGITLASSADETQAIHCRVISVVAGKKRYVSSFVWLRAW